MQNSTERLPPIYYGRQLSIFTVKKRVHDLQWRTDMKKTWKRAAAALSAAILILIAVVVVRGWICTKIATIVNDEAAWDLRDSSPSMSVLLLGDGSAARFEGETDQNYIGSIQDVFEVPKADAEVVTWYACDGKGIVYLKDFGALPAFSQADETSAVVGQLLYDEGYTPETYRCLGFRDGWFEIEFDGTPGFVREDQVIWDAIDSF